MQSGEAEFLFTVLEASVVVSAVRPKLKKAVRQARVAEILLILNAAAVWFEPEVKITDCRDEKDNRYLELALVASAIRRTIILSGDDNLLLLNPWRGISIVRPAGFLAAPAE